MLYADASELVAILILHPHDCGPDCLCSELRTIPAVQEEIDKLQKLQKGTNIDEQLVIDLARELYDRFVMGGWEPQDAYPQIRAMLSRARQA
jgi:hypothetical protein